MSGNDPAPVFVSADAARRVFDWATAIGRIQSAYSQSYPAKAHSGRILAREPQGWLRVLPAMPPGRYFGAKIMGLSSAAPDAGAQYATILFDRTTSRIAAIVDASAITGYRTAATSAAALDRIAPPGPMRLAVLGSGFEANMHVHAFAAIRPLSDVMIFSPTPAKREALAGELSAALGVPCRAVPSAEHAVGSADVVLAAARSHGEKPIVLAEWLPSRVIVMSIGSTVPEQREIDVGVVDACDLIVCDDVHEVTEETGDMIAAAQAGLDFRGKLVALSALIKGEIDARVRASSRPLFKSVGGGLQDIVIAGYIFDEARAAGLVAQAPIAFETKRRG